MRALLVGLLTIAVIGGVQVLWGTSIASAQERVTAKAFSAGLEAPELVHIKEELRALYDERPELFEHTSLVKERVSQANRRRRGSLAHVAPIFRSLGPDALLPMLYMIATDEPLESGLSLRAWVAYRGGMIEAVGRLRDPRSAPVLWAVLDGPDNNAVIIRAAAEGIAKLGDDAHLEKLIERTATASVEHRPLYVAALGSARRRASATLLAELAQGFDAADTQVAAVRALGDVGNHWAWQTSQVAASGEQEEVQAIATHALLKVYLHAPRALSDEALKSLMLINFASAPALVEQARKSATPEQLVRIDVLSRRLANNPLNRSPQSHD